MSTPWQVSDRGGHAPAERFDQRLSQDDPQEPPRPYWLTDKIKAGAFHDSFGLPSGHSQNSAAVWGWTAKENNKTVATWILSVMILLIGLSRIFLGVHFISDVLLGWTIGAVLVLIFARYSKQIGRNLLKLSLPNKLLLTALSALLMILFPAW